MEISLILKFGGVSKYNNFGGTDEFIPPLMKR